MFSGLMDPEMMRMAQEQMSRLRPEDLRRMQQQMMNNPELIRMASEGMKNLRPEDLKMAADQMKNIPVEQMADISERMAKASPEELASLRARSEAYKQYEYQGALTLKNQGNVLHGSGNYLEAAEKYARAKKNLIGLTSPEARSLRLTCSLNLMSSYLKTKQYDDVISEGSEVLTYDQNNLKALYRRGQAYKELGKLQLAFNDLKRASELSPEDETIADVLSQTECDLGSRKFKEVGRDGPIIEEITDDEAERFATARGSDTAQSAHIEIDNVEGISRREGEQATSSNQQPSVLNDRSVSDSLNALKQNPEMMRTMHTMMSTLDPAQVAELSGGGMTTEMAKLAANMAKQMSPDELQKMVEIASSFKGQDGTSIDNSQMNSQSRTATVPSTFQTGSHSVSTSATSVANISSGPGPSRQSARSMPFSGMPDMNGDMEQVRKQMKDPAMMEMMSSMMKTMTPEMMASMSEQLGIQLSPEEARQAQKAMSNLSPDELDRLMRWAERAQRLAEQGRRAKNYLMKRPLLILAVVILILAVVLHYFGVIGGR